MFFSPALETGSMIKIICPSVVLLIKKHIESRNLTGTLRETFNFFSLFISFFFNNKDKCIYITKKQKPEATATVNVADEIFPSLYFKCVLLFPPPLRNHIYTRSYCIINSDSTHCLLLFFFFFYCSQTEFFLIWD